MLEFYPTNLASTSVLGHPEGGHVVGSTPSSQFRQSVIDNEHTGIQNLDSFFLFD